jgi:hypothetical protein
LDDRTDNNIHTTFHPQGHPRTTLTSFDITRPSLGFPAMPPCASQHQIPRKIWKKKLTPKLKFKSTMRDRPNNQNKYIVYKIWSSYKINMKA